MALVHLPLAIRPLAADVDLAAAVRDMRLLCFAFPRRALRRVVGAATRFFDFSLTSDTRHTYDIMFTALMMKAFKTRDLARHNVERAFVDDSDVNAVCFYLLLKPKADQVDYNVSVFVEDVDQVLKANAEALSPGRAPAHEEGFGAQGGGGAHGGGRSFKKAKLSKGTPPGLLQAYVLINRPTIPVDHIRAQAPFDARVTAWGELVATRDDLRRALTHVASARLGELGLKVRAVSRTDPGGAQEDDGDNVPAGRAAGAAATGDSDTDDQTDPNQGAAANDEDSLTFHFEGGAPSQRLSLSLLEMLQVTHPLTERFVRESVREDRVLRAGEPDLWELEEPSVDLPYLDERYLASSRLYDDFTLYAAGVRGQADALEANPRGDLATLSSFFAERAAQRDADPRSAARLVYDVLTRPEGRLPKSISEMMRGFIFMLDKNSQQLPAGSGVNVVTYKNLSYSGNYAIYTLEQMEKIGTFHFHVEQFIAMLTLDGVNFRPRQEEGDEDASNMGMCANVINYGPPGVGKSNAYLFYLYALASAFVTNTYSSLRAMYSNLLCDDFLDCRASYNDEAPAWIPESSASKATPQEREQIAHEKEKLSSGKMSGQRLVRDDSKGIHKTVEFNVTVQNAPRVMNTNAPERSGHPPLLNRFVPRYYIYGKRAVEHALVMGAPPQPPEVKAGIRREYVLQRMLGFITSKLQADGIISFPNKLVFKSYYERFLAQLRENPYLDFDPPTAGDRTSNIIENMFVFLVNRMAIQRLFIDPDGKHAGQPFRVDRLLDLEAEMATGDMQAAILALGSYSHAFRSPTEYRVASMLSQLVLAKLGREYNRRHASGEPSDTANGRDLFFAVAPKSALSWSPDQESDLAALLGLKKEEEEERFMGAAYPGRTEGVRELLGARYVPITQLSWGAGTPNKFELCGHLAAMLLDAPASAGNANKIMVEHAQKRLHLLATVAARCGPDGGHTPLLLHSESGSRKTHVCALASWLTETMITHEHSMHSMLERAALACSYTAPGTYLTLEPFTFDRHPEEARFFGATGAVPKMMPYFRVPMHGRGCPRRNEAREADAAAVAAWNTHSEAQAEAEETVPPCTCFRNTRKAAQVGVEEIHLDPQVAAVCIFRRTRCAQAAMPPVCVAAPLTYPLDCLELALRRPSVTRGKPRLAEEVEVELAKEYEDMVRAAAGVELD
jgi:hypothetical protein